MSFQVVLCVHELAQFSVFGLVYFLVCVDVRVFECVCGTSINLRPYVSVCVCVSVWY